MDKKPTPLPAQWPQGYLSWEGSFEELVHTATAVLAELDPAAKPPTERTVRHYQQTSVVGRGRKEGRSAVFGFKDLEGIVTAKGLVQQGWTLDKAASLINSSPGVSNMVYGSPEAAVPAGAGPTDVVAQMMLQAGLHRGQPATVAAASFLPPRALKSSGLLRSAFPAVAGESSALMANMQAMGGHAAQTFAAPLSVTESQATYTSSTVESLQPTPWLQVYLDPTGLGQADPDQRALAESALQDLIARLRS